MTATRALLGRTGVAFLLACTGGQSSDDGAPRDSGYQPPDAGEGDAGVDAGAPRTEVIVGGHVDGESIIACGAGLDARLDQVDAVLNAPQRCEGWQSWFECSCDGELKRSYAYSCTVALLQACGVPAESIDGSGRTAPLSTECEAFDGEPFGRCTLDADEERYECGCAPPLDEPRPPVRVEAPEAMTHASCEQALFGACTHFCVSDYGRCEPSTDGTINAYECRCETNGLSRRVEERSCTQALEHACSPGEIIETSCSGYGGYCESTEYASASELRCTCDDEQEHVVDHVTREEDPRPSPCRDTLEATCGLGDLPEGALCMGEGNGYRARCTRAPSPESAYGCECYAEGSIDARYVVGEGDTCDESMLRAACLEIAPLAEDARAMACEHLETCGTRITDFSLDKCMDNAEDVCIACVLGELSRATLLDAQGCPSSRVNCHELCSSIVPKEEAVEACVTRAAEHWRVTSEARCLCDRCYPAFGACLADEGCAEIMLCASEQGCEGTACERDPICGPIIAGLIGVRMRSIALALDVQACEQRDACAALGE